MCFEDGQHHSTVVWCPRCLRISALLTQSLPRGAVALFLQSHTLGSIFPMHYCGAFGLTTLCLQTSVLLLGWFLLGGDYHQPENCTLFPLFPSPLVLQILFYNREKAKIEHSKVNGSNLNMG